MKKGGMDAAVALLGLLAAAVGLYLVRTLADPQGILLPLPYVCIGLGCGALGHGVGNLVSRRMLKNSPALQRQKEVNERDERNIAIQNRAKAKAYDRMTFVYAALMVSFALMGIDVAAVLLMVFAYLFVQGSAIYCRLKYDREM